MQFFPDLSQAPYQNPVLRTRPDISLEEEALASGAPETDIAAAWRDLELAETRAELIAATNRYIKLMSVPLVDAFLGVVQPPAEYAKTARYDFSLVFTHGRQKRVWKVNLHRFLTY
jgi:hypothetical protein